MFLQYGIIEIGEIYKWVIWIIQQELVNQDVRMIQNNEYNMLADQKYSKNKNDGSPSKNDKCQKDQITDIFSQLMTAVNRQVLQFDHHKTDMPIEQPTSNKPHLKKQTNIKKPLKKQTKLIKKQSKADISSQVRVRKQQVLANYAKIMNYRFMQQQHIIQQTMNNIGKQGKQCRKQRMLVFVHSVSMIVNSGVEGNVTNGQ